jgi:hypothetical protein
MGQSNLCTIYLSFTALTTQLLCQFNALGNTSGPNGMALGFESTIHIYRYLPTNVGLFLLNEVSTFSRFAESQIFISHDLSNGKAVMDFSHVDVCGFDTSHFVSCLSSTLYTS